MAFAFEDRSEFQALQREFYDLFKRPLSLNSPKDLDFAPNLPIFPARPQVTPDVNNLSMLFTEITLRFSPYIAEGCESACLPRSPGVSSRSESYFIPLHNLQKHLSKDLAHGRHSHFSFVVLIIIWILKSGVYNYVPHQHHQNLTLSTHSTCQRYQKF